MAVKYDKDSYTLWVSNVKVHWVRVTTPEYNPMAKKDMYSLKAFVTEDDKDSLEDISMNKVIAEVGVDKKKKGKNKGQPIYPEDYYKDMGENAFGFSATCPATNKKGKENTIQVVMNKELFDGDKIGNGSVVNLKFFAYETEDGEVNTQLRAVVVKDLVEYSGSGGGSDFDDEFGLSDDIDMGSSQKPDDDFEDDENPFS